MKFYNIYNVYCEYMANINTLTKTTSIRDFGTSMINKRKRKRENEGK